MRIAVLSETDRSRPASPRRPRRSRSTRRSAPTWWSRPAPAPTPASRMREFEAAGATLATDAEEAVDGRRHRPEGPPPARTASSPAAKPGALVIAIMDPYGQRGGAAGAGRRQGRRLRDGADAAHHPRAGDGRALLAGEPRRLPRRHRRRRRVRPRHADDDDGGRHRAGGARLRHGRGRRRPAGDRHGAAPRRRRDRDRRAARRQGAGRIARRQVRRRRGRGVQAGRDRRRLRQGDVGGVPGQAGGARRLPHRQAGHRHHDGADSRAGRRRSSSPARWWNR